MVQLTSAQQRVLNQLAKSIEGRTAYQLGATMRTMDTLLRKGLVVKYGGGLGSAFSPETTYKFKLKTQRSEAER